jgi:hypothetical protein
MWCSSLSSGSCCHLLVFFGTIGRKRLLFVLHSVLIGIGGSVSEVGALLSALLKHLLKFWISFLDITDLPLSSSPTKPPIQLERGGGAWRLFPRG